MLCTVIRYILQTHSQIHESVEHSISSLKCMKVRALKSKNILSRITWFACLKHLIFSLYRCVCADMNKRPKSPAIKAAASMWFNENRCRSANMSASATLFSYCSLFTFALKCDFQQAHTKSPLFLYVTWTQAPSIMDRSSIIQNNVFVYYIQSQKVVVWLRRFCQLRSVLSIDRSAL